MISRNPKSPLRLGRKAVRAASGGVIVIVALLALLFMQGPGTGDGESEESTVNPGDTVLQAAADPAAAMLTATPPANEPDPEDPATEQLTAEEKAAVADDTLVVLIDEHDYLIRTAPDGEDSWEPITLERLVDVAGHAAGDSNGIRVRIQKRVTARASAEQQIRAALQDAGIGSDAVFESSDLIE